MTRIGSVIRNIWRRKGANAYYNAGNVGIGLNNPTRNLEVEDSSTPCIITATTTGGATCKIGATTNQGQFGTISAHPLKFVTGNITKMDLGTNGRLGIGTTAPDVILEAHAVDSTLARIRVKETTNNVITEINSGASRGFFGTTSDHPLRIKTNGSAKMEILADGTIRTSDLTTNYTEWSPTGDQVFVGTAGLPYGEIYVKDNANATTLNSAAKVQITDFTTNGLSNNTTPDHTNDHITITKAGIYKVNISIHVNNNATQTHIIDVSLFKNNGTSEFNNVHAHRTLTGGSGDVGSVSMCGIIDLAVNDTLEVWATTDAAADRSVTFEDIVLNIVQVGGT